VKPASLSFSAEAGGADTVAQDLTISNPGTTAVHWFASTAETWILLGATGGELEPGASATVAVRVDPADLGKGTDKGAISVGVALVATEKVDATVAVTATVDAAATSTTLTASATKAAAGTAITFTAKVTTTGTKAPGGIVTFFDGKTSIGTGTLSGGSAKLATTKLAAGSHSITAVYAGDSFNASSSSAAVTVTITQAAAIRALGVDSREQM
jgi:hypothetical protein